MPKIPTFIEKTIVGIMIIYGGLNGLTFLKNSFISERIKDQTHLERVVEEEKRKLGISERVDVRLDGNSFGSYALSQRNKEGEYTYFIVIGKPFRRDSVAHELYHIHKGDLTRGGFPLDWKYWIIEENRANIYQLSRLRL